MPYAHPLDWPKMPYLANTGLGPCNTGSAMEPDLEHPTSGSVVVSTDEMQHSSVLVSY
jgi:hypothetical protein